MAIYVLSPYVGFAENSFNSNSGPGWFCSVKTASGKAETMECFPPYSTNSQPPSNNYQLPTTSYPPSNTITYFYDGDEIENEEDSAGDMSTYLTRSVRGVVDTSGNVNVNYLLSNDKDVIGETDSTGNNITTTYNYDAYGKSVDFANPSSSHDSHLTSLTFSISDNPFQYSGYYCDKESGLYYLKARYYSPELMTFISMDTYDLANKYAYCNNDPIDATDPNGHMSLFVKILITAIDAVLSVPTAGSINLYTGSYILSMYAPKDVCNYVNYTVIATTLAISVFTLGVGLVVSGFQLTSEIGQVALGGAVNVGVLADAIADHNKYSQIAVGIAVAITGLLMLKLSLNSMDMNRSGFKQISLFKEANDLKVGESKTFQIIHLAHTEIVRIQRYNNIIKIYTLERGDFKIMETSTSSVDEELKYRIDNFKNLHTKYINITRPNGVSLTIEEKQISELSSAYLMGKELFNKNGENPSVYNFLGIGKSALQKIKGKYSLFNKEQNCWSIPKYFEENINKMSKNDKTPKE